MLLIIGLGNPGKEYEKTRHNAGFIILNKIKENYNFPDFKFNKKFNAEISKGQIEEKEILLVKPQTFMNNSGQAVGSIMDFYKLTPENILVIHDDIDIEFGKNRIASDSGSAGHNGIRDIIEKIGTQKFARIRIGIANEKLRTQIEPTDFVTQKFSEEELKLLNEVIKEIFEKSDCLFFIHQNQNLS